MATDTARPTPDFATLLQNAVTEPGTISAAYSAFYGYSLGNQLFAACQCAERGIPIGPIATFNRWRELGRFVTKGSKAILLCMPVTCKRRADDKAVDDPDSSDTATFTRFVFRPNWFVLAQTDGQAYTPPALPDWDLALALAALQIAEVPFEMIDGNVQGFARDRSIAISAVAANPLKTTFHEIAHILLGHTAESVMDDGDRTPRNIREVEAEGTALLVCAALNLPGLDDARGYIQHWYGSGQPIPEASARKIFKAADAILKAGRPAEPKADA